MQQNQENNTVRQPRSSMSPSSDAASEDDHIREKRPRSKKVSRPQQVKAHFTRFWKWYLLGLIILLAILLPILFTVIIPAVVQLILNKAELPLEYAEIIPKSPTDILVSLNTSFKSPLPATLGANTLYLYNEDTTPFAPYLPIPLPTTKVNGKTQITIKKALVKVINPGELVKWFRDYLTSDEKDLNVRSNSTDIYLGKLHYTPNFDKIIRVPGLKSLKGVSMTDLKTNLQAIGGKNLWANAILPNWGPITLGLGNLTLEVLSGTLPVGKVTAYDVLLKPGNNTVACDGFFNLTAIVANLGNVLQTQSMALGGGNIDLGLKGTDAMLNGERLTYVEDILKDKVFTVSVPLFNLATSLLDGLLGAPPSGSGGNGSSDAKEGGSTSSVLDAIGSAFGNKTLMDEIKGYWDL